MKTKCFAFDSRFAGYCSALKVPVCKKGNCKFFKTAEEQKASVEKAKARLEKLPYDTRKSIVETYGNKQIVGFI